MSHSAREISLIEDIWVSCTLTAQIVDKGPQAISDSLLIKAKEYAAVVDAFDWRARRLSDTLAVMSFIIGTSEMTEDADKAKAAIEAIEKVSRQWDQVQLSLVEAAPLFQDLYEHICEAAGCFEKFDETMLYRKYLNDPKRGIPEPLSRVQRMPDLAESKWQQYSRSEIVKDFKASLVLIKSVVEGSTNALPNGYKVRDGEMVQLLECAKKHDEMMCKVCRLESLIGQLDTLQAAHDSEYYKRKESQNRIRNSLQKKAVCMPLETLHDLNNEILRQLRS